MMMSGQAGASGPWYKVDGNSWVVNTQTKGSKAVADVYQQLIDNKAPSPTRVGMHRLITPSSPVS